MRAQPFQPIMAIKTNFTLSVGIQIYRGTTDYSKNITMHLKGELKGKRGQQEEPLVKKSPS